jgi:hypothetical protein
MNINLNLHLYKKHLRFRQQEKSKLIYDPIRKKYVVLQPEELVRQLLLAYILEESIYPLSRIRVEKAIKVNEMLRRFDIVIYDKSIHPFLIIETKSHAVKLSQETFDQVARYNIPLKAPYLLITNGFNSYCAKIDHENGGYTMVDKLPFLSLD